MAKKVYIQKGIKNFADGYQEASKKIAEEAYEWLKNYAWVEDNKVNHSTLLHDFFKDFRKYM